MARRRVDCTHSILPLARLPPTSTCARGYFTTKLTNVSTGLSPSAVNLPIRTKSSSAKRQRTGVRCVLCWARARPCSGRSVRPATTSIPSARVMTLPMSKLSEDKRITRLPSARVMILPMSRSSMDRRGLRPGSSAELSQRRSTASHDCKTCEIKLRNTPRILYTLSCCSLWLHCWPGIMGKEHLELRPTSNIPCASRNTQEFSRSQYTLQNSMPCPEDIMHTNLHTLLSKGIKSASPIHSSTPQNLFASSHPARQHVEVTEPTKNEYFSFPIACTSVLLTHFFPRSNRHTSHQQATSNINHQAHHHNQTIRRHQIKRASKQLDQAVTMCSETHT